MVRAPFFDNTPLKKGAWSPEEDLKLRAYIKRYGIWNWTLMPKAAGLLRSGKSCRLRWMNYLRPDLKRGNFSREEEDTILELHEMMGNRWSAIAARLPGRSDNEIKNHWHTKLKKRRANPKAMTKSQAEKTPTAETSTTMESAGDPGSPQLSTESDSSSSNTTTSADGIDKNQTMGTLEDHQGFWAQPLSVKDNSWETLPEPELELLISEKWVEQPPWICGWNNDNYWLNLYMEAEILDGI